MDEVLVCPSILSADLINLSKEVDLVKKAGAKVLHVDVMDGNFVDNISFGIPVVECLKGCGLFLDVHLMVAAPLKFVQSFVDAGADSLTFHVECNDDIKECVLSAKKLGCKVGLALSPKTGVDVLRSFLDDDVDLFVIMTVEPGFAGQKFVAAMLEKVRILREWGFEGNIAVDGGVNFKTAKLAREAGANWIVAGSAVFGSKNYDEAIKLLGCRFFD